MVTRAAARWTSKTFLKPDDYFELSDVADRSRDISKALTDYLDALFRRRSGADSEPLPSVLLDEGTKRR